MSASRPIFVSISIALGQRLIPAPISVSSSAASYISSSISFRLSIFARQDASISPPIPAPLQLASKPMNETLVTIHTLLQLSVSESSLEGLKVIDNASTHSSEAFYKCQHRTPMIALLIGGPNYLANVILPLCGGVKHTTLFMRV